MSIPTSGQPLPGVVQPTNTTQPINIIQPSLPLISSDSYATKLIPATQPLVISSLPLPTVEYHHGEPQFVWMDKDVDTMVIQEDLQFSVVGKFAYGMPDFQEVKKQIPLQLDIKGECTTGLLDSRHVLIRLSLLEDYVHLLSRPAFYVKIGSMYYQLRGLKYDVWFDPKEETSTGVAWISFPGLPPVFFVKEAVFALATAVGKPLQLDAATRSKTRPSCAKVKVEVDLLAPRPERVRIGIKNSTSGETRFKWIRINYDYIPKYCKQCRLQGHDEEGCYVIHPDLIPKEHEEGEVNGMLRSGKTIGNENKSNVDESKLIQDKKIQLQEQRSGRNQYKQFVHPNRNPNAWTIVEDRRKNTMEPESNKANGGAVKTKNAFSILQNDDDDAMVEDNGVPKMVQQNQTQVGSTNGSAQGTHGVQMHHHVISEKVKMGTVHASTKQDAEVGRVPLYGSEALVKISKAVEHNKSDIPCASNFIDKESLFKNKTTMQSKSSASHGAGSSMPFNDLCKEKNEAHELEKKKNAKRATAQGIEAEGLGLEKELIPTARMTAIDKECWTPNLNRNASSFLSKSVMQVVPHSNKVPTDEELVKQMDSHDTRGILSRQAERKWGYCLEDDDTSEDDESDEEKEDYVIPETLSADEYFLPLPPIRDITLKKARKEIRHQESTRKQSSKSTKSKTESNK